MSEDGLYEALRGFWHPVATDTEMLDFNAPVIGKDLAFVESQRPEELPVDLSAEFQIAGVDRVAIEYRRWLREIAKGPDAARHAAGQRPG